MLRKEGYPSKDASVKKTSKFLQELRALKEEFENLTPEDKMLYKKRTVAAVVLICLISYTYFRVSGSTKNEEVDGSSQQCSARYEPSLGRDVWECDGKSLFQDKRYPTGLRAVSKEESDHVNAETSQVRNVEKPSSKRDIMMQEKLATIERLLQSATSLVDVVSDVDVDKPNNEPTTKQQKIPADKRDDEVVPDVVFPVVIDQHMEEQKVLEVGVSDTRAVESLESQKRHDVETKEDNIVPTLPAVSEEKKISVEASSVKVDVETKKDDSVKTPPVVDEEEKISVKTSGIKVTRLTPEEEFEELSANTKVRYQEVLKMLTRECFSACHALDRHDCDVRCGLKVLEAKPQIQVSVDYGYYQWTTDTVNELLGSLNNTDIGKFIRGLGGGQHHLIIVVKLLFKTVLWVFIYGLTVIWFALDKIALIVMILLTHFYKWLMRPLLGYFAGPILNGINELVAYVYGLDYAVHRKIIRKIGIVAMRFFNNIAEFINQQLDEEL